MQKQCVRGRGQAPPLRWLRPPRTRPFMRLAVGAGLAPALLLLPFLLLTLSAASPTFWTVSTQADFLKGDADDISIDTDGRLSLGPSASTLAETSAPFLWTILAGADGTIWAGSGNEGQVLKVTKDGKLSVFFDAQELEVH